MSPAATGQSTRERELERNSYSVAEANNEGSAEEFETGNITTECKACISESLFTGHMHTPVWMPGPRDTQSWELLPQHRSHTKHIISRGL